MMTTRVDDRPPELTDLAAKICAAEDPLAALVTIRALRVLLAEIEVNQVEVARSRGASWTQVGARLGITKQAAAKRFRPPVSAPGEDAIPRTTAASKAPTKEPPVYGVTIRGSRFRLFDVMRIKP